MSQTRFFSALALALLTCMDAKTMAQQAPAQSPAPLAPDELAKVIAASDAFFAQVGAGKVAADQLLIGWTTERERDEKVIATIGRQAPSLVQAKFYRRRGVALLMLSKGKGDEAAGASFNTALAILEDVRKAGSVPDDTAHQMRATLLKESADNKTLLGDQQEALKQLEQALTEVRQCSLKGKLGEGTILERVAGLHFRAERWQEALTPAQGAVAIMEPLSVNPAFDKGALRTSLWYVAICNSRLGNDAEQYFDKFLRLVGRDITPHDESDVYREAAVNVNERAAKQQGDARKALLRKGNSYLLKAKQIIDVSDKDEDVLEKMAIYSDLGVSYALGGLSVEAEHTFKAAVDVAVKSPAVGKDSPALIPVRKRYATFLRASKREAEGKAQQEEVERIEALHKK